MLLKGKIAIITGAASQRGIGKATARLFAEHGAKVAILDSSDEASKAAAAEIGGEHIGVGCDVRDKRGCERAVKSVLDAFGKVDVLVNNAGSSAAAQDHAGFARELRRGTGRKFARHAIHVASCHPAYARPQERQHRSVFPRCRRSAAAAFLAGRITAPPKAGCLGWRARWRASSVPDNVRVNSIARVSSIPTSPRAITGELKAKILEAIPLGRIGETLDVANACLYSQPSSRVS